MSFLNWCAEYWFFGIIVLLGIFFTVVLLVNTVDEGFKTWRSRNYTKYLPRLIELEKTKSLTLQELQKSLSIFREVVDSAAKGNDNTSTVLQMIGDALRFIREDTDEPEMRKEVDDFMDWMRQSYESAEKGTDSDEKPKRTNKRKR